MYGVCVAFQRDFLFLIEAILKGTTLYMYVRELGIDWIFLLSDRDPITPTRTFISVIVILALLNLWILRNLL